ncbi:hypothetical protein LX36DRAFT_403800 [Colletotrichum falcatum]|nr:hypothetical protein LX36DRAFT_403800 [Colletotrichum falcatum]
MFPDGSFVVRRSTTTTLLIKIKPAFPLGGPIEPDSHAFVSGVKIASCSPPKVLVTVCVCVFVCVCVSLNAVSMPNQTKQTPSSK